MNGIIDRFPCECLVDKLRLFLLCHLHLRLASSRKVVLLVVTREVDKIVALNHWKTRHRFLVVVDTQSMSILGSHFLTDTNDCGYEESLLMFPSTFDDQLTRLKEVCD